MTDTNAPNMGQLTQLKESVLNRLQDVQSRLDGFKDICSDVSEPALRVEVEIAKARLEVQQLFNWWIQYNMSEIGKALDTVYARVEKKLDEGMGSV